MSKGFSGEAASPPSRSRLVILGEMLHRTGNAPMQDPPARFRLTLAALPGGQSPIVRLRAALKTLRRYGLRCERVDELPRSRNRQAKTRNA
jgi:hypothetical protein